MGNLNPVASASKGAPKNPPSNNPSSPTGGNGKSQPPGPPGSNTPPNGAPPPAGGAGGKPGYGRYFTHWRSGKKYDAHDYGYCVWPFANWK